MNKPFHLQPLLDLSNLRLDEASRQLGKLIAGEQEASQRLELLTQYRDEYQARFVAAAGQGLGPDAWRNYQHFLGRLDAGHRPGAHDGHGVEATHCRRPAELARQTRQGQGLRYAGAAPSAAGTYAEARIEQKQSDEHTARRFGVVTEDE